MGVVTRAKVICLPRGIVALFCDKGKLVSRDPYLSQFQVGDLYTEGGKPLVWFLKDLPSL